MFNDPWKEAPSPGNALQLTTDQTEPSLLLVIFIHGYKGSDQSFNEFPQRIQHILSESLSNTTIECTVFPAYEVRLFVSSPHALIID
jgi:uncharacterized alpha/beta hydrolase family protein